jgi:hypothetical protein
MTPKNSPEPTPIALSVPHSRLTDLAARLSFCREADYKFISHRLYGIYRNYLYGIYRSYLRIFTAFIFRRLPVVLIVSISAVAGMAAEVFMFGGNMNMRELFTAGLPSAFFGYVFHRLFYAKTKPSAYFRVGIFILTAALSALLVALVIFTQKLAAP